MQGESNMDSDCQLFLGDPQNASIPYFSRISIPIGTAFIGLASSFAANAIIKRPLLNCE